MKLSEAMMLASTTGKVERNLDWEVCALGISAAIDGVPSPVEMMLFGQKIEFNEKPLSIEKHWPWLGSYDNDEDSWIERISDLFEWDKWPVAKLAEYVRSIEPDCGECNRFECICVKTDLTEEYVEVVLHNQLPLREEDEAKKCRLCGLLFVRDDDVDTCSQCVDDEDDEDDDDRGQDRDEWRHEAAEMQRLK